MSSFSTGAVGIGSLFTVTGDEFLLRYLTAVTRVSIDGVEPPILGADGGSSVAFLLRNHWSP